MCRDGRRSLLVCLALLAALGCRPPESRITTAIKSAAEIKITVGKGVVAEAAAEPAASPAAPASSSAAPATPSVNPSTAAASPGGSTPAPSPAPSSSAPAAQPTDGPAKLVGRVIVSGTVPALPPKLVKGGVSRDAICAENEIADPRLVTSADGGLANVIIYMAKPPASGVPPAEGESPQIDQKGCVFYPHILLARVGQPVKLLNSDPVAHNVNFTGLADQFNQILGQNQSAEYNFRKSSRLPIPIKCDIHGWMSAHVIPLDHPWAAVTDANGNFEISNIPDGDHEFVVWHEAVGYIERGLKVKAQAGQAAQLPVSVDISKFKL